MTSCAAGAKDGASKKAPITMVKADIENENEKIARERWIDALAMTYDDIIDQQLKGKAVVSMSWGANKANDAKYDDCVRDTFANLMNQLLNIDVPPVVAAGNSGFGDTDVNTWPALLGETTTDLLVIGGVQKDNGWFAGGRGQNQAYVKIIALAEDVECADRDGSKYTVENGTSQGT